MPKPSSFRATSRTRAAILPYRAHSALAAACLAVLFAPVRPIRKKAEPKVGAEVQTDPVILELEALRMRGVLVRRNKPCPCGSGKKFKRCHLEKVAA